MSGKVNYGALYLVREMTVWLLCFFFSGCCIPPFAAFSFAAASPAAADADAVAVAVAADFSLPYHIIFLLYNFCLLIPLYPTFVQELDREHPPGSAARLAMDIERTRVFRDENGYHVCEVCCLSKFWCVLNGEANDSELLVPVRTVAL